MDTSWIIELKFNSIERLFHQYRIQNNLVDLPPSMNAKIGPQHVALVDEFVLKFENSIREKVDITTLKGDDRAYLSRMKKYFCEKCSFLNELISCYAANLTDNEIQIYFYRKMIRLINELNKEQNEVTRPLTKVLF